MRLISWNVNGLRSCLGKGCLDFCAFADADVICLQETKMRPEQAEFDLPDYHRFWNSADKAGYSCTAICGQRSSHCRSSVSGRNSTSLPVTARIRDT